jgi:hypothetical protein
VAPAFDLGIVDRTVLYLCASSPHVRFRMYVSCLAEKTVGGLPKPKRAAHCKAECFTEAQVRQLVAEAVAARDKQLRELFDQDLREALQGTVSIGLLIVNGSIDRTIPVVHAFQPRLCFPSNAGS